MSDLVLYTNPQSRGRIVQWMIEETGAPYRIEWLAYGPEGTKSTGYLSVNPMGKVPAITHDGQIVTEVPAICAYLAARFPANRLMPALDSPQLGSYFRWLFFAAGPIEQAITAKAFGWQISEEQRRTIGFGSYEDTVSAIDGAVKNGPFVCGDQFTAADVYLGSHLNWGMAFDSIEKKPAFVEYVARCTARPAYARAEKIAADRLAESQ